MIKQLRFTLLILPLFSLFISGCEMFEKPYMRTKSTTGPYVPPLQNSSFPEQKYTLDGPSSVSAGVCTKFTLSWDAPPISLFAFAPIFSLQRSSDELPSYLGGELLYTDENCTESLAYSQADATYFSAGSKDIYFKDKVTEKITVGVIENSDSFKFQSSVSIDVQSSGPLANLVMKDSFLHTPNRLNSACDPTFAVPRSAVFHITNDGTGPATLIGNAPVTTTSVDSGIQFYGGTPFPGTYGTCSDTLGAGESCSITLAFAEPTDPNVQSEFDFDLDYNNGVTQDIVHLVFTVLWPDSDICKLQATILQLHISP